MLSHCLYMKWLCCRCCTTCIGKKEGEMLKRKTAACTLLAPIFTKSMSIYENMQMFFFFFFFALFIINHKSLSDLLYFKIVCLLQFYATPILPFHGNNDDTFHGYLTITLRYSFWELMEMWRNVPWPPYLVT